METTIIANDTQFESSRQILELIFKGAKLIELDEKLKQVNQDIKTCKENRNAHWSAYVSEGRLLREHLQEKFRLVDKIKGLEGLED